MATAEQIKAWHDQAEARAQAVAKGMPAALKWRAACEAVENVGFYYGHGLASSALLAGTQEKARELAKLLDEEISAAARS